MSEQECRCCGGACDCGCVAGCPRHRCRVDGTRLTPEEWQQVDRVNIHDPDGWRGSMAKPWGERIDHPEWLRRMLVSTISPFAPSDE